MNSMFLVLIAVFLAILGFDALFCRFPWLLVVLRLFLQYGLVGIGLLFVLATVF